jgi:hypothetical protein
MGPTFLTVIFLIFSYNLFCSKIIRHHKQAVLNTVFTASELILSM